MERQEVQATACTPSLTPTTSLCASNDGEAVRRTDFAAGELSFLC